MENCDRLIGQLARLPDGQRVKIETVYSDGYAFVRRIDGEWSGQNAICAIAKLLSNKDCRQTLITNYLTVKMLASFVDWR